MKKQEGGVTLDSSNFEALSRTAWALEIAHALGRSKRLSPDVYTEMTDCRWLFGLFGSRIPRFVDPIDEEYFTLMKEPVQELAVQMINVIRYHKEASTAARYLKVTKLPHLLCRESLDKVYYLVDSIREIYDLDKDNLPIAEAQAKDLEKNCPIKAFEKYKFSRFVFTENMEQFKYTPAPRKRTAAIGVRAKTPDFKEQIFERNLIFIT